MVDGRIHACSMRAELAGDWWRIAVTCGAARRGAMMMLCMVAFWGGIVALAIWAFNKVTGRDAPRQGKWSDKILWAQLESDMLGAKSRERNLNRSRRTYPEL